MPAIRSGSAAPRRIAASLLVGVINGVLIAYVRIPSFVVTLGMLSVARSAAMVLSQNKMIFQFGPDEKLLFWLGGGSTFGIANPVIVLVAARRRSPALMLKWTRWGCHVFAIGSNEKAAVLTGIARAPAEGQRLHVLLADGRASPAYSRPDGWAASPPISASRWSSA